MPELRFVFFGPEQELAAANLGGLATEDRPFNTSTPVPVLALPDAVQRAIAAKSAEASALSVPVDALLPVAHDWVDRIAKRAKADKMLRLAQQLVLGSGTHCYLLGAGGELLALAGLTADQLLVAIEQWAAELPPR